MNFIPLNGRKFLPLSGTNAIPGISSRFTPLNGLKCLAKAKIQMPLQADKKIERSVMDRSISVMLKC